MFCTEHLTKFDYFLLRYEVPSEIKKTLKTDKEFRNKFLTDMVYDFCYEESEEWHKNNTPDSKMYHDPYDALFYGSYPYRFKMGI